MLRACYAYLILNKYFQENWGLDYYQPELPTMEAYKRLGKTKADISPFLKVESLGNSTYRISVGQPFLERLKCLIAEERGE